MLNDLICLQYSGQYLHLDLYYVPNFVNAIRATINNNYMAIFQWLSFNKFIKMFNLKIILNIARELGSPKMVTRPEARIIKPSACGRPLVRGRRGRKASAAWNIICAGLPWCLDHEYRLPCDKRYSQRTMWWTLLRHI